MEINKLSSQQQINNSTSTISAPSLLRSLKEIFDKAIETPAHVSKNIYSSERVCRDLKNLLKDSISH
ncbi:MAG: hypothetical protein C5B45_03335 [Chlamydiae bacterium]|nr:MAG: hypothetical protein C5B45_03335 [Chlamydiota bacterium]